MNSAPVKKRDYGGFTGFETFLQFTNISLLISKVNKGRMDKSINSSSWHLFCFPNCNPSRGPEGGDQRTTKLNKLSLKKVLEEEKKAETIKRSVSDQNLTTKYGSETSRSHR